MGKQLNLVGYTLIATALLVRGWIPVLLFIIVALIAERRNAGDEEGR